MKTIESLLICRRGRGGGAGLALAMKQEQIFEEEKTRELARLEARKEFEEKEKLKCQTKENVPQ